MFVDKASIWFSILTSGPEENFGVTEPPLVVHRLDRLEDDLCSRLEVRGCRVHLDYLSSPRAKRAGPKGLRAGER